MNEAVNPGELPELFVTPRDMRPGDFILSDSDWCKVEGVYQPLAPDRDMLIMTIDRHGASRPCWRRAGGEYAIRRQTETSR